MEGKVCSKCKEFKLLIEFSKNNKGIMGRASACKACRKIDWQKNKEEKNKKALEYYYKNKEKCQNTLRIWKEKNKEKVKEYKQKNKERERENARKRYRTKEGKAANVTRTIRYRARKKKLINDFTSEQWIRCLNHFKESCCYCGKIPHSTLEQDHFVPIKKGGHSTRNNMLPACRSCNASKSAKDFFQWYPANENYSYERMVKILDYLNIDKNTILIVDKN